VRRRPDAARREWKPFQRRGAQTSPEEAAVCGVWFNQIPDSDEGVRWLVALDVPMPYILIGGKNVTPDIYSGSFEEENLFEETHTFGDNWEENIPVGIGKFMLGTGEGLYDDRAIGQFAALRDAMNTQQLVALLLAGDTPGDQTIMLNGDYVIKYNRTPAKDGLTKASAEHAITGERLFGDVLNGMTAIGADGNTESTPADVMFPDPAVTIVSSNTADETFTTATDITVGGTGGTIKRFKSVVISTSDASELVTTATPHGLVVGDYVFVVGHSDSALNTAAYGSEEVLTVPSSTTFTVTGPLTGGTGGRVSQINQVSAKVDLHYPELTLGGYTSVTVTIRHCDDNSTWALASTATAVTVAGVAERLTVANLKRFRAIAWTWQGSGSGQSVVAFVTSERP
jgi:hypothetical protein